MEHCKVKNMYDLTQTLAAPLLETVDYPWEALPKIGEFIKEIGPKLDPEVFERRGENIWIAKSVSIAATATLNGPLIIDEDTEVRPGAFIRGNVIVGKNCVVGNSTELKNVILFNVVQVPHYNYVGDSVSIFGIQTIIISTLANRTTITAIAVDTIVLIIITAIIADAIDMISIRVRTV